MSGTESAQKYDVDRRKEGDRAADGRSAASERLFADSREANRGSSGGQFDNQLVAKLEEQGILPQLAIEFTKSADANDLDGDGDTTETAFSAIDTDGQDGITLDELQVARTSENASVLDSRLLQQLSNDYEDLRFTTITTEEGISQDDVNHFISAQDARLSNDTQVREASARLLLNPDLFNLADTAAHGGTGDGSIEKTDLENLINKFGRGELPSSVTQDDINSMQFLVDNFDEPFVYGDDSGIRDTEGVRDTQSGTGITRASIQAGLGLPTDGSGNQALFDQVGGVDSQFHEQYAAAYGATEGQDGSSAGATAETEDPVHTTDANGATVTTYMGEVTAVEYPDGQARAFGYDESNSLIAYRDVDGSVYNFENGAWVSADGGQPAPFSDVSADQSGNVTVTNTDGSTTTFDTLNVAQVPAASDAPAEDSVGTVTVQAGQGFDRIARDVYAQALGHAPTVAEEIALSELIAAANDNDRSYSNGGLTAGDELVIPNLQQLAQQAEQQGVALETYIRSTSEQIIASLQSPADSSASTDESQADSPAADEGAY